jgi:hypothetical protein
VKQIKTLAQIGEHRRAIPLEETAKNVQRCIILPEKSRASHRCQRMMNAAMAPELLIDILST